MSKNYVFDTLGGCLKGCRDTVCASVGVYRSGTRRTTQKAKALAPPGPTVFWINKKKESVTCSFFSEFMLLLRPAAFFDSLKGHKIYLCPLLDCFGVPTAPGVFCGTEESVSGFSEGRGLPAKSGDWGRSAAKTAASRFTKRSCGGRRVGNTGCGGSGRAYRRPFGVPTGRGLSEKPRESTAGGVWP